MIINDLFNNVRKEFIDHDMKVFDAKVDTIKEESCGNWVKTFGSISERSLFASVLDRLADFNNMAMIISKAFMRGSIDFTESF